MSSSDQSIDFSDESENDSQKIQRVTRSRSSGTTTDTSGQMSRSVSTDYVDFTDSYSDDDSSPGTDISHVQKIFTHRVKNGLFEFLVKMTGRPYRDCMWITEDELLSTKGAVIMHRKYLKLNKTPPTGPFYDKEWEKPERVICEKDGKFLVKWCGLDYDEATWETDVPGGDALIKEMRERMKPPPLTVHIKPPPSKWQKIEKHRGSNTRNLQVRRYQLDGLNFMVHSWFNNRNVILADEMGLGKTVQASIFLNYLAEEQNIRGPFLVVAPLSTIPHWEREIAEWTCLRSIAYYGISQRRKIQKQYEMFFPGSDNKPMFHVLITTYEFVIREAALFSKIHWKAVVIDEAHRLKNKDSKLSLAMRTFETDFKLLMTGTPLQNNTDELWALLNFLDIKEFEHLSDFQARFGELNETDQIVELKAILKPLMIRRMKGDVEKDIIPLEEIIVECPMASHQRAYYKNIYDKNLEYLTRGLHAQGNSTSLQNIFMELRKVCNHPYLITGAERQILQERKEMQKVSDEEAECVDFEYESLIRSAGKMVLLDKLLAKLKADGHRVLIFSQMTRMLDIIQDYLTYREYPWERLDGGIRGDLRQAAIDRFNAPGSDRFVFLLCTKAGGVGINLTTADRVIIYDSDWNPQNDIQATARCHRIGQTKEVKMYRFITAKSYERKMFDRASVKLGLDRAVLESGNKAPKTEEMEKLLRLGAYYAFEEKDENDTVDKFGEEDIDAIISRSRKIKHEGSFGDGSNFSVAQFELDEADNSVDLEDPNFWQKYLPEVIEDDVDDIDDISIAERRRLKRESRNMGRSNMSLDLSMSDTSTDEDEYANSFEWSKKKITSLQTSLLKFGWGRWRTIHEHFNEPCTIASLKSVCYLTTKWLIQESDGKHPMIESMINHSHSSDNEDFEKIFTRKFKRDITSTVLTGATWKLQRLDQLYFLHQFVSSCGNAPDELEIPEALGTEPAEWWTREDDKALIYAVWKSGFQEYDDIKFSKEEPVGTQELTKRVKSILKAIKTQWVRSTSGLGMRPTQKGTRDPDVWSKREHQVVIRGLVSYGYPSVETFREVMNLTYKTNETLQTYYDAIMSFCNDIIEGKDPETGILVDAIATGTASRIVQRQKLFADCRKLLSDEKEKEHISDEDRELLELVTQKGLFNLVENDLVTKRFGTEGIDGKVIKKLKDLCRQSTYRRIGSSAVRTFAEAVSSAQTNTLFAYAIPQYEKNEDGTPKLPLPLGSNLVLKALGKVVYDRATFHSPRYIYPDGYVTERLYPSVRDPSERVWWRSTIVDTGGDGPVFRVEMRSDPTACFEGTTPTAPWVAIIKALEDRRRELGLPATRCLSISGPDYFGLSNPLISQLLKELPNADKCDRFMKKPGAEIEVASDTGSETEQETDREPTPEPVKRTRSRKKCCLKLDLREYMKNVAHKDAPDLRITAKSVLQRDALDVALPVEGDLFLSAINRMRRKVEEENL